MQQAAAFALKGNHASAPSVPYISKENRTQKKVQAFDAKEGGDTWGHARPPQGAVEVRKASPEKAPSVGDDAQYACATQPEDARRIQSAVAATLSLPEREKGPSQATMVTAV